LSADICIMPTSTCHAMESLFQATNIREPEMDRLLPLTLHFAGRNSSVWATPFEFWPRLYSRLYLSLLFRLSVLNHQHSPSTNFQGSLSLSLRGFHSSSASAAQSCAAPRIPCLFPQIRPPMVTLHSTTPTYASAVVHPIILQYRMTNFRLLIRLDKLATHTALVPPNHWRHLWRESFLDAPCRLSSERSCTCN
jgi:hypothetical protein